MKLYEGMFVMDVQTSPDVEAMEGEIRRILDRADAEVTICRRWEDRRLAYEIEGRKRGSYWLTYFNAPPERIVGIERDVQLSERVLRVLVLKAEQIPEAELAPPAEEKPAEQKPEEKVAEQTGKPAEQAAATQPTEAAQQPAEQPAAEGQPAAQPGGVAPTPPAAPASPEPPAEQPTPGSQPSQAEGEKPEGTA